MENQIIEKLNLILQTNILPAIQLQVKIEIYKNIFGLVFFIVALIYSYIEFKKCDKDTDPVALICFVAILFSILVITVLSYTLICLILNPEYYIIKSLL